MSIKSVQGPCKLIKRCQFCCAIIPKKRQGLKSAVPEVLFYHDDDNDDDDTAKSSHTSCKAHYDDSAQVYFPEALDVNHS